MTPKFIQFLLRWMDMVTKVVVRKVDVTWTEKDDLYKSLEGAHKEVGNGPKLVVDEKSD